MKTIALSAVLALTPVVAAAQASTSVPKQFQGEWNSNLEHCGTGLNDSRLIIREKEVRYFESGGPVLAAVPRGRFELALVLELSGEGSSWMTTMQYNLSSDGNRLMDMRRSDEPAMIRYRCPNKAG
jgi:hypothetical protein